MKNTLALSAAAIALLMTPVAHAADVTGEFNFSGTLADTITGPGSASVSGQFDFDFTTDTVTKFKLTAPGDSFDSSISGNSAFVAPFTSGGTSYLSIDFISPLLSNLDLSVNPTITEFFTQELPTTGATFQSTYSCVLACDGISQASPFASGAVSPAVPEPSTWALMTLGFGLLGGAGYWTRRQSAFVAA